MMLKLENMGFYHIVSDLDVAPNLSVPQFSLLKMGRMVAEFTYL